ncbi:endogenous retrovirus group K member 13-1 Env polyprotein-like [Peromyscus californicus insignis]|uniref:endogenous retrovirus group K member 13-1 Env polyprotein-like n=1 Tax=Peromyscus californicus insignis TaxID=564181 RepID=UPI0022A7F4AA|nr:endogenous retrovirus group K member 13-1 Env polyprotein-like [Peromyscus californicus insignis]XP_052585804.1 endogenous retrovirus group K member 13-1 Env polyprotein-like [Peromyscus californicus insignis]XP_052585805.1 endogenous retrovirus group K member 13-1 Env polyprotein-like [Peromyscus californicus insignis]
MNETFQSVNFMPLDSCITKYRDKNQCWDDGVTAFPTWLRCGFPHAASSYNPLLSKLLIWDFSASSGEKKYEDYISKNKDKFHNYTFVGHGEKITRWFSPGYVEPVWVARTPSGNMRKHPDLFRLVAASGPVSQKRPKETTPSPIAVRACISYPFALLLGSAARVNISALGSNSYHVTCFRCIITNCISPRERQKMQIMMIVKRPPFIMMPVQLHNMTWYDNSALQVLRQLHELIRPKRFVAALILGITALISIITTFAIATTALVQEIHTAQFVNDLNKNISFALSEQAIIDKKLEAKINILEEVVLALGQDVANIKKLMETRCHQEYKAICVTPLPYNSSENWDKVKHHLLGVWKDSSITHDLEVTQKDISAMSQAHIQAGSLNVLAQGLQEDLKAMNPLDWIQYFIFIGILALIVVCVIVIFPCLFRTITRSLGSVREDLYAFCLKNKKGGTATPTTVSPRVTNALDEVVTWERGARGPRVYAPGDPLSICPNHGARLHGTTQNLLTEAGWHSAFFSLQL